MKVFLLSVVLFQSLLLVRSEDDYFLKNLKHQFAEVPRDVKLFDFLQDENNLRGLLGLHNDMCEQLTNFNELKAKQHRARRDADTTVDANSTTGQDTSAPLGAANVTVDANAASDASTAAPSTAHRRRRDASDSSASTTNTTASSNPADDKDQQQNLNDQQPPADDQGDQQAPAGEANQEAEMQAAGVAYFKQLVLNVIRYILNCLMTYINIFY
uniref:Uncharacterized protein n=1 Tax=Cacopsylla melanoneura TaxID=428564 RepID=A0A8D8PWE5_9HEMI